MCYSNASFHLSVSSVPHWSAGYPASIFSLAGWKIIFWIPVFLLFNITRSGNDRSPGNLNKLANWLKSSSFRLSRQRAHLQEFALIRLSSILRSAQWVTVYRLCIQKWKYIFLSSLCCLQMEIYNSLWGNIFLIKEFIIHIIEKYVFS